MATAKVSRWWAQVASFNLGWLTREEYDRGDAASWRLPVGRFHRASGLEWAWIVRGTGYGETDNGT